MVHDKGKISDEFMSNHRQKEKAVILASGGLDSTVTAAIAKEEGYALLFLTVRYGQRHEVEIERARHIAAWLGAEQHKVMTVDLGSLGGSALTGAGAIPKNRPLHEPELEIPPTYVPARNILFLSLGLAYAEIERANTIFLGANIRDYSGYPDCRPEFLEAFQRMAQCGTKCGVEGKEMKICAPLLFLTKAEIIQKGHELNVPFQFTHSCYDPDPTGRACGQCDSCLIRREGFLAVGLHDPALPIF